MTTIWHHRPFLIVLPACNEAQQIGNLLEKLSSYRDNVLVVDDGSTDRTPEIIRMAGFRHLSHDSRKGLHAVFITAEQYAMEKSFTRIVSMDADGQHDPAFLDNFIHGYGKDDMIIGNRFRHPEGVPPSKLASNLFAVLLFREKLNICLPDVACGFRSWPAGFITSITGRGKAVEEFSAFEIIYRMIVSHARTGNGFRQVEIPAIYLPGQPLTTRAAEIKGLIRSIPGFEQDHDIPGILECLQHHHDFTISLQGFTFIARMAGNDTWLFQTDIMKAMEFFRSAGTA